MFECNFRGEMSEPSHGLNGNIPATSGINASDDSPTTAAGLTDGGFGPDFEVHVLACVTGLISASDDNENSKQYPDGNYKPTGLIQEYGEDERIHFGLFTGTYEKNISGGVLRKNTGPLDDEIDIDGDGTFKADPNSAVPAVGVIRAIDKFAIYGYGYGQRTTARRYFDSASSDNCGFQLNEIIEGECVSWGNPMSELCAETVRYFAGLAPTPSFDANDNTFVGGLDEDDWEDPLTTNNFCAELNIVMINSSLNSYDDDQTEIFTDIGAPSPVTLTNAIGTAEGYDGNDYFVSRTAPKTSPSNATNDEFCTPKTVNNLGTVAGKCPEGPTIDGTYHVAGMAHYANTTDIRPLLTGTQTITTYAVQLATNVPQIDVLLDPSNPDTSQRVAILPAYRLIKNDGGGTLVDFKIVQQQTADAVDPDVYTGKYMVLWEDSEQGGDFDQDMWGIISYELDTSPVLGGPATIEITTDAVNEATSNGQLFGFIVSGTTEDGFHAYSGIEGATFADPIGSVPDCNDEPIDGACHVSDDDVPATFRSHTFTTGPATAELLPDPLLLAAKYGAFVDSNDNGVPDLDSEFDIRDQSGNKVAGGDGIPDTYYFVTNPAALEDSLRSVFDQVIERVASGTAAAVVASEQEGTGALFQALYDPIKTDTLGNEVDWIGTVHALFVDGQGFLREDTDDDDKLDGYDVDQVIEIFFDETQRRARLRRFSSSSASTFVQTGVSEDELENLNPIWNAREQLSAIADADITTHRAYNATADSGRHILTWLDDDLDGLVATDGSETVAFVTGSFSATNSGWLDVTDGDVPPDADEALKLVDFTRGLEIAGDRSRTLDYTGDGTAETIRLADVVQSTPTVQGRPSESFDLLSLDASYAAFREEYDDRRNVVYLGANDGLIRAFNGGFFDAQDNAFKTQLTSEVAHPLGAEIWAYIPKNLLGHLQWLADPDYTHVYYVDLKPRLFDAKIFAADATHPNGWGTVLVVGMRLGGGHDNNGITLDTASDGIGAPNAADDVMTKSAYVVLDVTDPEQPPTVIAELSPPDLFFTTSFPAAVLVGAPQPNASSDTTNEWYLVFGSGPDDLGDVDSSQSARLFAYDLRELVLGNSGLINSGPFAGGFADSGDTSGSSNGTFVGEITVADQDLDMKAEALYFGTVGGIDSDGGNLFRMTLAEDASPANWGSPYKILDVDQPFSTRPSITLDSQFNTWIIAGTGRLFTNVDKNSAETQTLYGFIDPEPLTTVPVSPPSPIDHTNFIDVTDAITYSSGDVDLDGDGDNDTTFDEAETDTAIAGGWLFNYDFDSSVVDPSERTVSNQTLIAGALLSTAFTPTTDLCGAEGSSRLIARSFNSGLIPPLGVFGQKACDGCPDGVTEAVGEIDLGAGLASSPSIHVGNQDVPGKVTVIVQQSTGAITGQKAQTLGGLNNSEISWREFRGEW